MSAQANLAGLYPPTGNSVWNENLMWQPIPIHTVPEKDDEILAMKKPCPKYKEEYLKLINSKDFQHQLKQYKNLMDYLTAYTGEEIKLYNDILYIYSNLYIETLYNFTLPNWTNTVFPTKMRTPACYSFKIPTATNTLKRLKVGPLLKQIMHNLENAAHLSKNNNLKLSVYSAHDDTVAAVLNSLDIFDGNCPDYTSTVIIELMTDETQTNTVRISYRNSTKIVEPHVLTIPYCGKLCPLDRFKKLYDLLVPNNWEEECNVKYDHWMTGIYYAGLIIVFIPFLIMRCVFLKKLLSTRFEKNYKAVEEVKE